MKRMKMMQIGEAGSALGSLVCATALVLGLAFGGVVSMPERAFASEETVEAAPTDVMVAQGQVQLAKLTDTTVLVELLKAKECNTVSIKLGARTSNGSFLTGLSWAFTPEAQALPLCHDIVNGDYLALVVSNRNEAISPDSDRFVLGTLTVPAGAASVGVFGMDAIDMGGVEQEVPVEGDAALELVSSSTPSEPDQEDPSVTPQPPNGEGEGGNGGNGGTGGSSGTGAGEGAGTTGGTGNNGSPTVTSNGGTSKGSLPQTGDGHVVDASAFLLIGGAAALAAGAVVFLRRRRS